MSSRHFEIATRPPRIDLEQAARAKSSGLHTALAQMGYPGLREVQRVPVENVLAGRDIMVVAPTSAGKTAMFTVPTLALGWRTLIFSPLVALMRDQVLELQRRGVAADFVNSQQSNEANHQALANWAQGKTQMLYVAPERLQRTEFHAAMTQRPPDMVTIDECHCLSQWADNFRSDYYVIGQFIADYNPRVVFACTATCTEEIEADVCRAVGISPACTLWQYYRRDNLTLQSRELLSDWDIVRTLEEIQGKTVIYFSTVKRLEEFVPWLNEKIGRDVGVYHGQMNRDIKTYLQDAFKNGDIDIICATNAFGLGVNVEDIRAVIHHDPPGTPEALSQEVGRAGRDDKPAICITYHHRRGWMTQENFIERGHPSEQEIRAVWEVMRNLGGNGSVIKKTGDEIAKMAKIQSFGIYAIMETLSGAGCIGEADVVDRIAKVSFKGNSEDETFQEYKRLIKKGGLENNGNFYDINLDWLRQQVGVTDDTVVKRLKQWEKDGFLDYSAPFRGKPRVLTGDISRVDFERLANKRQMAWQKLKKAQEYMDIPDREKHDWFADYFAHWGS